MGMSAMSGMSGMSGMVGLGAVAVPANADITVVTPGADAVAEGFSVTGGVDEQVSFGDGSTSGAVHFDAGGIVDSVDTVPDGYTAGTTGGPAIEFSANSGGAKPDMLKTSSGGGIVTVDPQGSDAVNEVVRLDLDGANGGTYKITDGTRTTDFIVPTPNDTFSLNITLGTTFTNEVAATSIENYIFHLTWNVAGVRPLLAITESTLTKPG
jgi:hypothetical protein